MERKIVKTSDIIIREKHKEEGLTEKLYFKVTPAMRRAVEIVAREYNITMGDVLRSATAHFLRRYKEILDAEIIEVMERENFRRVFMAKPEEYLEGLEIINNLMKRITKEMENASKSNILDEEFFDYLLKMVEDTRDVLEKHKQSEYLLKKLEKIKTWLEGKKALYEKTGML